MRAWVGVLWLGAAGCSLDVSKGRPYPCQPDASTQVCSDGWVCGLEERCHPGGAGPWRCNDDTHCFGWHCGLGRECYSKSEAVVRTCDFASEQLAGGRRDCADGFRCGRNSRCHPLGQRAPYACEDDLECEGPDRCDALKTCVDPAPEAAGAGPKVVISARKISPVLLDRRPSNLSASTLDFGRSAVSWAEGAQLFVAQFDNNPEPNTPFVRLGQTTLPFGATATAQVWRSTFALSPQGFVRADWLGDGGWLVSQLDAGFLPTSVVGRQTEPLVPGPPEQLALAWNKFRGAMLFLDGGVVPVTLTDAGQLLALEAAPGLVALTQTGLFELSGGSWNPLPLLLPDGGDAFAAIRPQRVVVFEAYGIYAFEPDDGGSSLITSRASLPSRLCRLCPQGRLVALTAPSFTSPPSVGVVCADQGALAAWAVNASCAASKTSDLLPSVITHSGSLQVVSDVFGALSIDDRLQPPSRAEGVIAAELADGVLGGYALAGPSSRLDPAYGWASFYGEGAVGTVNGIPRSIIAANGSGAGIYETQPLLVTPLGQLTPRVTTVEGLPQRTRAFGAASSLADGGTWWSLAYSDRLFGGTGPVLDPLFSPLPGSPSISIAFPNTPSNADYTVRGYVLSATSLAQVQLRGGTNWRSDPIDPPLGKAIKLQTSGTRAWLSYNDGRLVSLPSRLQLTERLPGRSVATDFAQAGGVSFAGSDGGVFRTADNPDGGVLKVWRPVPLPPASSDPGYPLVPNDLERVHFVEGERSLYLLNRYGVTFQLTVDGGGS